MESVGISKILVYLCQSTGSHIAEGRDNIRIRCRDNFVAEKIFLFAGNMPEVNLTAVTGQPTAVCVRSRSVKIRGQSNSLP